jgi:hypothetical protein
MEIKWHRCIFALGMRAGNAVGEWVGWVIITAWSSTGCFTAIIGAECMPMPVHSIVVLLLLLFGSYTESAETWKRQSNMRHRTQTWPHRRPGAYHQKFKLSLLPSSRSRDDDRDKAGMGRERKRGRGMGVLGRISRRDLQVLVA